VIGVLGALLPLFVLIALGYLARWIAWPGPRAWRSIERLTYYILFPALLFTSLARTSLAGGGVVALALALATVATAAVSLLTHRPLALSGPTLTSVIQGAVRPNTYVGVGAALALWGNQGVALAAVGLAVVIPIVNVIAVMGLLRYAPSAAKQPSLIASLVRNPLIMSCLAGLAANAGGLHLPSWLWGSLKLLGQASLPLGLLAVGAALELSVIRSRGAAVAAACGLKLIVAPAIAAIFLAVLGVEGTAFAVAVVYMGVPTSASAYVLAVEMGGDRDAMATIISASTILSAMTLPAIVLAMR
jgi:malonate transporter